MQWRRRFGYEFAASLGFYAVLLVLSISLQVRLEPVSFTRYALAALPMLGCVATLVTFGWGFLELAGAPRLPTFFVWPIMGAGWMVGTLAATRRYR